VADMADDAPPCPGPRPAGSATRFTVPHGAVDTHAHVIGLPPAFPFAPGRAYTPPEASPDDYLGMLDAVGMTYGVLVQVSVHGTDNRLMTRALRLNQDRLRGVAVVALDVPESELHAMTDAGVRGLRINAMHGGGPALDALEDYAALCHEMGWHLQMLVDPEALPELAPRLCRLRVPVVMDHMGNCPAGQGTKGPAFQALLGLVRDGAWVKLSGAFRAGLPPYAEATPMARALLEAAPGRCVWGSDWPHVATWGAMPSVGELLDLLADWAPEAALREAVLVANPARLYGFGPQAS
jgi:2-pyrone-4,6-dicarboxylate lactonase